MKRTALLLATAALAMLLAGGVAFLGVKVPAEAAFPGQNGDIAFQRPVEGSPYTPNEIFKMDPTGQTFTQLTSSGSGVQLGNFLPRWSSDGTKIAFTSYRDGNEELYVMDANGDNQTNLTDNPAADSGPAWFPDGRRLAFTSWRDGNTELYVMTLDESGLPTGTTRLTNNAAPDWGPAVSPDGRKIAFVSERDGDQEIYVIKSAPEGPDNPARKRTWNLRSDTSPDWSPDGTRLVWQTLRHATGWDIMVMNSRRGGKITLTNFLNDEIDPTFSPDGQYIVFSSNIRDGNYDLWRMRTDGTEATNLTPNSTEFAWDPDWQPLP